MYKMEINVSGQQRVYLFRGPGCRKAMLEWWRDYLLRAEADADVRSIRVWGTVGNKTDIVLEWQRHDEAGTRSAEARTVGRAHSPPPQAASPLSRGNKARVVETTPAIIRSVGGARPELSIVLR